MWSKNIYSAISRLILAILLVIVCRLVEASPAPDSITIIYPKEGQTLGAVDSSFIFGSVPSGLLKSNERLTVRVNGEDFPVYRSGGFIAFVPLTPGEFTFRITVHRKPDIAGKTAGKNPPVLASKDLKVIVPEPLRSPSPDTLRIAGEYMPPRGNLVLLSGEVLEVSFKGTPSATAWFSVDGVADSVPMVESRPRPQPYWGEAVFGEGAAPDSMLVTGIYSGFLTIPADLHKDSVSLTYYLSSPSPKHVDTAQIVKKKKDVVSLQSSYKLSINPRDYPFTVRFKDSVLVIRHAPTKGYFSPFQPRGVEALAVGAEGDWYKLQLSETQVGWVSSTQVERLPFGTMPPRSEITSIREFSYADSLIVQFPTSALHPFRAIEDDRRTLRLQLFGVLSNTDWIRYDFSDSLVDLATWTQPEKDLYEFKLQLRQDIWGYDCYYKGTTFILKLIRPPKGRLSLKGKTIVLDPGHSQDPGSIGPTGYTEAEANLGLALAVRDLLVARGAKVVMTRPDMRNVPLYDRPVIAKTHNADIFVSIHNNALPDGVNPFVNLGVSTYYYHPHSIDLARAIQTQMIKETGLPDYGLYNGNLAVIRPPQYPAVLVECAFIILPQHESMLKTTKFRQQVARAITTGITNFLRGYNNGK